MNSVFNIDVRCLIIYKYQTQNNGHNISTTTTTTTQDQQNMYKQDIMGRLTAFMFYQKSANFRNSLQLGLIISPPVFIAFFHLHSAILKPDFYLSLGQIKMSSYFIPTVTGKIHVKQKFLLQFENLMLSVWAPLFPCRFRMKPVGCRIIWKMSVKADLSGKIKVHLHLFQIMNLKQATVETEMTQNVYFRAISV